MQFDGKDSFFFFLFIIINLLLLFFVVVMTAKSRFRVRFFVLFQEIMEESIAQAIQSEQDGMATSYPELSETRRTPAQRSVPGFDMRTAVDVSLGLLCFQIPIHYPALSFDSRTKKQNKNTLALGVERDFTVGLCLMSDEDSAC